MQAHRSGDKLWS